MTDERETTLPISEETLSIAKTRVSDGRVRVTTRTDVIKEIADLELASESVTVTRVPFDVEVAEIPVVRTERGLTIIPVFEERVFIEKRLFPIEEIHIVREGVVEAIAFPVELRKQTAVIERSTLAEPTKEHDNESH